MQKNSLNRSFHVRAPISKFWEEDVTIKKGLDKTEKSKERFIEVTVSGLEEDRDNEKFSQSAIDDMIMQFKSGTIPFFPDHGRDERTGQPNVYSWKQMMGVWADARQENTSLKAVVRLNKSHPDAEMFWSFVKNGMPIGFSIGGKPQEEPEVIELSEEPEFKKVVEEAKEIPTSKIITSQTLAGESDSEKAEEDDAEEKS